MSAESDRDIGRLLLRCADRPGLVAAVSTFLADAGANIVSLDQHSTAADRWNVHAAHHLSSAGSGRRPRRAGTRLRRTGRRGFGMDFRLTEAAKPKRVAIMASKEDHCLLDLLWRNRRGELDMSVVMVIANHPDLADQVRPFGVPFIHVPAHKDIRDDAERRQLDLLRGNVDLVVLARYMQIVTPRFLDRGGLPADQHPSLVPARVHRRGPVSAGQGTRRQTRRRDGPLRHREPRRRADHRTGRRAGRPPPRRRRPDPLGADVERAVLSRAVLWHCEDRIIRYGNQTIVF